MKVYKDKQFLIFDFENDKKVYYNFATRTTTGVRGKVVNNLKYQLRGYNIDDIINSCTDKQYGKYMSYVYAKRPHISNVGTLLEEMKRCSRYEQFFSAHLEDIVNLYRCSSKINDIPRGLIKLARKYDFKIDDNLINIYRNNPDIIISAFNTQCMTLVNRDLYHLIFNDLSEYIDGHYKKITYFNELVINYNYQPRALIRYCDELKTFEAIDDMNFLIREIYDYARMMSFISKKYDKYPRHFLTTHKIACRTYDRFRKHFNETLFKKVRVPEYECSFGDYVFLYPKTVSEIKDEAVQQNNCVASYIDDVIDGKCHIMFLRKKERKEDSLVTLEIRNNKIVQAKRRFNYSITDEQQEIIDKWNKRFADFDKAI